MIWCVDRISTLLSILWMLWKNLHVVIANCDILSIEVWVYCAVVKFSNHGLHTLWTCKEWYVVSFSMSKPIVTSSHAFYYAAVWIIWLGCTEMFSILSTAGGFTTGWRTSSCSRTCLWGYCQLPFVCSCLFCLASCWSLDLTECCSWKDSKIEMMVHVHALVSSVTMWLLMMSNNYMSNTPFCITTLIPNTNSSIKAATYIYHYRTNFHTVKLMLIMLIINAIML